MGKKDDLIMSAAQALFLERGYDATSLDDVAYAAGVSKTTVYANFGDKEALFAQIIESITGRAQRLISTLTESLTSDGPINARIEQCAVSLLTGLMRTEVIQLRRLAIAEAARFPHLAELFWNRAPATTIALLTDAFRTMDARGELRVTDPDNAATQFAYLVTGVALDRAMFLPDQLLTPPQIQTHAKAAVATFVSRYGPQPEA